MEWQSPTKMEVGVACCRSIPNYAYLLEPKSKSKSVPLLPTTTGTRTAPNYVIVRVSFDSRGRAARTEGGGAGGVPVPVPVRAVGTPEQPGGKMVAELVGAFNQLTHRMTMMKPSNSNSNSSSNSNGNSNTNLSTSSSRLLFKTLKLAIPILQALPPTTHGHRPPLSKALSVAFILADLQVPCAFQLLAIPPIIRYYFCFFFLN